MDCLTLIIKTIYIYGIMYNKTSCDVALLNRKAHIFQQIGLVWFILVLGNTTIMIMTQ